MKFFNIVDFKNIFTKEKIKQSLYLYWLMFIFALVYMFIKESVEVAFFGEDGFWLYFYKKALSLSK